MSASPHSEKHYAVDDGFDLLRDGELGPRPEIFRDSWEEFGPKELTVYFEEGFDTFMDYLVRFKGLKRKLTEDEVKDLRFMLDALVYAKNSIHKK